MIDASHYDEKVREMKKNEFIRLLNYLGAKTVDMDIGRGETVAKKTSGNVTVGVEPTNPVSAGGGSAKNSAFAEEFKIAIENEGEDPNIRRLEDFVAENDCSGPGQLLPFFEEEKYKQGYIFIREEISWLQMAYNRVVSNQSRVVCHVKYESSRDQSISANAKALAGIFAAEAERYSAVVESVAVKYAICFHGEEEDTASARRASLRSTSSSFSEDGRNGGLPPLSSTRSAALVNEK
jgi:hypothetical protein